MDEEIDECNEVLDTTKYHLDVVNKQRQADIDFYKKKEKKDKLKTILLVTGSGVVGVAAGIVIGFFAIR
jgi:hypothetical protein